VRERRGDTILIQVIREATTNEGILEKKILVKYRVADTLQIQENIQPM
jgi:hypothetical protein